MAVSACFGAPSFNLLLGAGLAITYVNILDYPDPVLLHVSSHVLLGFGFVIVSILSSVIIVPASRFMITTKKLPLWLILLYFVFTIVNILVEVDII